jgi:hypothetical protein
MDTSCGTLFHKYVYSRKHLSLLHEVFSTFMCNAVLSGNFRWMRCLCLQDIRLLLCHENGGSTFLCVCTCLYGNIGCIFGWIISYLTIFTLGVCILLRIWDQGWGVTLYATIFVVYTIIVYWLHVSFLRPSSSGHIYWKLTLLTMDLLFFWYVS